MGREGGTRPPAGGELRRFCGFMRSRAFPVGGNASQARATHALKGLFNAWADALSWKQLSFREQELKPKSGLAHFRRTLGRMVAEGMNKQSKAMPCPSPG